LINNLKKERKNKKKESMAKIDKWCDIAKISRFKFKGFIA
jgi:hypothetical protein